MNNLTKAYPIRLTQDQDKAIKTLESKGFNRSKLIRSALNSYLYSNFRNTLKEIEHKNKRIPNAPNWVYE